MLCWTNFKINKFAASRQTYACHDETIFALWGSGAMDKDKKLRKETDIKNYFTFQLDDPIC